MQNGSASLEKVQSVKALKAKRDQHVPSSEEILEISLRLLLRVLLSELLQMMNDTPHFEMCTPALQGMRPSFRQLC